MIVETMTYKEISNAFMDDVPELKQTVSKRIAEIQDKSRRILLKSHHKNSDELVFLDRVFLTLKSKNKYMVSFCSHGFKEFRKEGLLFKPYLLISKTNGIWAMALREPLGFIIYTSHMFARYRTRFLNDDSLSTMDVMDKFHQRNSKMATENNFHPNHPDSLFAVVKDGVILLTKDTDNIWIAKTFVNFDMLRGEQIDKSTDLLAYREQMINLLKKNE